MSTDAPSRRAASPTRRARSRKRRGRAFAFAFAGVVGLLATLGIAGAAVSTAQGPRVTDVQVDPAAAVAASGSRLIVTTSQALREIDADQVTVTPATPFAVDTSGRSLGVRFTLPLHDDTEYTVTIEGVGGLGGGPATTITQKFRTGDAEFFLLQRGDDEDRIFRTDLSGEKAVPVFRLAHIEDFRATTSHLVVSVRGEPDGDDPGAFGPAELIVTDLDGLNERSLPLPGTGSVTNLQSSDRADLVGFTFTDDTIGTTGGRESMLFTISLKEPDAEPVAVEVTGADNRVVQWRFVPGTDRVLFVGFDGTLWLADTTGGAATPFGTAMNLDDVSGSTAVIERPEGLVALDLETGLEQPLAGTETEQGLLRTVLTVPGGGTLRLLATIDDEGLPVGSAVSYVQNDGSSSTIAEFPLTDAVIRTCVSPNGRYAAMIVGPDMISNPYDTYLLPVPQRVQTHIVEISTGDEVVTLAGFDSSWCRVPPQ